MSDCQRMAWGTLPIGHASAGEAVELVVLRAGRHRCTAITLGCTIQSLEIAGRDVVLGFDSLEKYAAESPFFGCVVGRHAGRLEPKFCIDDVTFNVPGSDGGGGGILPETSLHGGKVGFDKRVWTIIDTTCSASSAAVIFGYTSPDGEQGFPGEVKCTVQYTLTENGELHLRYSATTDKPTVLSLTNHSYFNLNQDHSDTVRAHSLQLLCDHYAVGDPSGSGVPTGDLAPVSDTVQDFRVPQLLGPAIDNIATASPHWPHGEGFVVRGNVGKNADELGSGPAEALPIAAILTHPSDGFTLTCRTSEPQLQTYYSTLLENVTVNRPAFPSHVCRPTAPYAQHTVYSFTGWS